MKERILFGIGGVILGIILASIGMTVMTSNPHVVHNQQEPSPVSEANMDHQQMSMQDMSASLLGKNGDEFDALFLQEMIVHHQGAIDMARLASTSAKHQEIKELSRQIISAQEQEIQQMEDWLKSWGYKHE